jgi:uncharacterized protein (DUF302 family)
MSFEAAVQRIPEALKTEGFGVLNTVDMKATLEAKVGAKIGGYLIFGACNPIMAYRAIQIDPTIGLRLPCNVLLRELETGGVEVRAIDPLETIGAEQGHLREIAKEVRPMLARVVARI